VMVRQRWRGFTNADAVEAALRATGLPVTVLRITPAWNFTAQVAAFAGTGLLVAAHGAGLTNALFMPPHAAVIEVFPYAGVVPLFRRVADVARLSYYPLYSEYPSLAARASGMEGMEMFNDSAYLRECVETPVPSMDGPLHHRCNLPSKRAQLEVPLDGLALLLRQALDDIGCRRSVCRNADGSYTDFRPQAAAAAAAMSAAATVQ
jgi:hypothetical protein